MKCGLELLAQSHSNEVEYLIRRVPVGSQCLHMDVALKGYSCRKRHDFLVQDSSQVLLLLKIVPPRIDRKR